MIIGGDKVIVIFIYSVSFLKFVLRKLLKGVLQAGILESVAMIMFFAVKDGEALYSQQKQDWELTVAQIMNSLLPTSD